MNIKSYDPLLQTSLLIVLIVLNIFLLFNYASWFILLSIILLKVYQIIGGGGVHLWACHSLGNNKLPKISKPIILFFWNLCGIGRPSYFCKYHILHHARCDMEGDPHSPNDHNPLTLTLGLWSLSASNKDKFINPDIQKRMNRSYARINNSIFDRYYYLIAFTLLLISFAISPFFCLYFISLPMLLNIIDGNFFFVYWFHKEGQVRDVNWADYWIANSGKHRIHHRWLK
jgi:fatty-acid desaturase